MNKKTVWIIVGSIVVVLAGIYASRFLIRSYTVPTGSMENTIMSGEMILVRTNDDVPVRGGVFTLLFPGDRDQVQASETQYYLERCVAIAGDVIEVRESRVFVNGEPEPNHAGLKFEDFPESSEDHLRTYPPDAGFRGRSWGPMRVPKSGDRIVINDTSLYQWRTFILREGHTVGGTDAEPLIDDKPAREYVVERDYWFAMGDNRNNSEDSRYWGFVPYEHTAGRAWIVLSSPSESRSFSKIQ